MPLLKTDYYTIEDIYALPEGQQKLCRAGYLCRL